MVFRRLIRFILLRAQYNLFAEIVPEVCVCVFLQCLYDLIAQIYQIINI
jgi:hypothetical protein